MTYETHKRKITATSNHQLFVFSCLNGKVIGKVVYEWGDRPFDVRDYRYTVRQIRSK